MAKTQKKTATKTTKQVQTRKKTGSRANTQTAKKQEQQQSNMFFVVSMSVLAGALLFANIFMMVA